MAKKKVEFKEGDLVYSPGYYHGILEEYPPGVYTFKRYNRYSAKLASLENHLGQYATALAKDLRLATKFDKVLFQNFFKKPNVNKKKNRNKK